jgi:hypothetical protein
VRGPRIVNLLAFSDPCPGSAVPSRLLDVDYMPNGTLRPAALQPALAQVAAPPPPRTLRALHDAFSFRILLLEIMNLARQGAGEVQWQGELLVPHSAAPVFGLLDCIA